MRIGIGCRRSTCTPPNECPGCVEAYAILGLEQGATDTEVKSEYHDLVKVWHPDRFSAGDERLRLKAEAKLRVINEAYEHITSHRHSASSETDLQSEAKCVVRMAQEAEREVATLLDRWEAKQFGGRSEVEQAFERAINLAEAFSRSSNALMTRVQREVQDSEVRQTFETFQKAAKRQAQSLNRIIKVLDRIRGLGY
jgi:curved DNA-binding protein CbpA